MVGSKEEKKCFMRLYQLLALSGVCFFFILLRYKLCLGCEGGSSYEASTICPGSRMTDGDEV